MFDYSRIPKNTYYELVELMGKADAENYIKSVQYDYRSVMVKILELHVKQLCRTHQKIIILGFILYGLFVYWKEIFKFFSF